jgi:hypothetical protein
MYIPSIVFWLRAVLCSMLVLVSVGVSAQEPASTGSAEHDESHGAQDPHDVLEEVVVTATPLARNAVEMSQSASVLRAADIFRGYVWSLELHSQNQIQLTGWLAIVWRIRFGNYSHQSRFLS